MQSGDKKKLKIAIKSLDITEYSYSKMLKVQLNPQKTENT